MKRDDSTVIGWGRCRVVLLAAVGILGAAVHCKAHEVVLLLQLRPDRAGIITPAAGLHHFEANSQVMLTAIPKPGYQFVCWLGEVSDRNAASTVAYLDKPKIIIAVFFEQIMPETLSVPDGISGGRMTGGWPFGPVLIPSRPPVLRRTFSPPSPPPPKPPGPVIVEPPTVLLVGLGAILLCRRW